jgi:serine/threonine protein phosphatase PrpC
MNIHTFTLQGKRPTNEDQHFNLLNLNGENKELYNVNFVGVFDGHGGDTVSTFLKKNLPKFVLKKTIEKNIYTYKNKIVSEYINKAYTNLQNKLTNEHPILSKRCGSTAVCGIHYIDENKQPYLWTINVGDSRAVLCNYKNLSVQLTKDHKPNYINEKSRIEKLGGKLKFDGVDWRIKDLSLSRAFGDGDTHPYVTHKPEISKIRLNKKDKFVIFACDGLWDVVSNNKAVKFVDKLINENYKGNIAKKLAEYAIEQGSYDNVTVSILFL